MGGNDKVAKQKKNTCHLVLQITKMHDKNSKYMTNTKLHYKNKKGWVKKMRLQNRRRTLATAFILLTKVF